MRHESCCVVECKNTSRKTNFKFYRFPTARWKIIQRNQWIAAVKRVNPDGSPWVPRPHDCICSAHFVGGKKSEEILSPSYIPTIFPSLYKSRKVNEYSALNRYKRLINRRMKEKLPSTSNFEFNVIESIQDCQTFADKKIQADNKYFGFASLTKDQKIMDLTGVSLPIFDLLLTKMCTTTSQKYNISKNDQLLIVLMKIKTGLSFSALAVLFNVNKTTICRIFYETVQYLTGITKNLVFLPNFNAVQKTRPDCFLSVLKKIVNLI